MNYSNRSKAHNPGLPRLGYAKKHKRKGYPKKSHVAQLRNKNNNPVKPALPYMFLNKKKCAFFQVNLPKRYFKSIQTYFQPLKKPCPLIQIFSYHLLAALSFLDKRLVKEHLAIFLQTDSAKDVASFVSKATRRQKWQGGHLCGLSGVPRGPTRSIAGGSALRLCSGTSPPATAAPPLQSLPCLLGYLMFHLNCFGLTKIIRCVLLTINNIQEAESV